MPASQVTSIAFGGKNLDILFVTSAAEGLSQQELLKQPQAGGLFQIKDAGVRGLLPNIFYG